MAKPTTFPQADDLSLTTEIYTQRNGASAPEANFRFTLEQVYLFLKVALGFSDAIKHEVNTPASTWTIAHNLRADPEVQVFVPILSQEGEPTHQLITAAVKCGNGQVVIEFNEPTAGYALLNP